MFTFKINGTNHSVIINLFNRKYVSTISDERIEYKMRVHKI